MKKRYMLGLVAVAALGLFSLNATAQEKKN